MRNATSSSTLCLSLLLSGCAPGAASPDPNAPSDPGPTPVANGPQVAPQGGNNLLKNSDFEDGTSLPWTTSFTAPAAGKAAVENGAFCLKIDEKGVNPWDAQVRHREMVVKRGHTYTVRFKAWASKPMRVRPKVGMAGPPYAEYWSSTIELKTKPQRFEGAFAMSRDDDPTAELAFHMGGNLAAEGGVTICLDDIHLDDPDFKAPPPPPQVKLPKVRVNQVGYFPGLVKKAIVKATPNKPLAWEIVREGKESVAKGTTAVFGDDPASGEHVHVVDFTSFAKVGDKYELRVEGETSFPFNVRKDLYGKLKYDALAYFYHNRSGMPIAMPYAGEEKWARPAGHTSDKSVPCAPGTGCSYSLDVSGGWYDAGDHGKYVVNGGISVWTMLAQYERAKHIGTSSADFGDGKLAIPENKNGVPDILDEARYELEWMLKMQVPEGQPRAGMVHHKVHDEKWTGLGLAPHEANMKRFLRPPSTAATLNLAANAAQAARIWKTLDPAFAEKTLAAAEKAWAAAKANPAVYAPPSDNQGGGPYDDIDVSDEFYWAAAELFITTGKEEYQTALTKSKHYMAVPQTGALTGSGSSTSMTWQMTQALGTISLAVVPNKLDKDLVAAMRSSVVAAADAYLGILDAEGYRLPFKAGGSKKYPWGSNSFLLNNLVILALSHDFTGKPKYLGGAVEGMDYILGKNPMVQSYVSGFGSNPLKNPHHRFWANQVDAKFPTAPPGAVSGGPNSGLDDPYGQAAGLAGCAPQKCFVDHIEAWGLNEITINWNAPLAWIAAFLDEKGRL
ncbi:glycoside hydrolase family 9 protein [Polyangium sorediatum]|uniref:Endoglucanase n=1 Tax=Polyangium sorediatum TaxID=889274 RepID=A0ABT6NS39_9BACT|nr:glycoside hydrolase family 9 protein [Polyangium sorediatum]MDI1431157.1 glycoside hydrolase family 9 protein [Polyangium sorediatum]